MKMTPCLLTLCALASVFCAETLAAGWMDILPGHFRGVQYFGARRYLKPIAPQTQPPTPPVTVSPTPPPLPGTAPAATPSKAESEKAKAEREAALKRTIEFQKKRAQEGSVSAQFDLGKRYLTGDGLEKNLAEARKWFEAAAKQGHAGAATKLEEVKKLEAKAAAEAKQPAAKAP